MGESGSSGCIGRKPRPIYRVSGLHDIDRKKYLARYNARLSKYGHDPRALGWGGGRERQNVRFKNLLGVVDYISSEITSLLDVGCGFGDLSSYLEIAYPSALYTGLDINQNFIDIAKKKGGGRAQFYCGTLSELWSSLPSSDVVVESGIFNAELNGGDQLNYIEASLRDMYAKSNYAVAADFMTDRVDWQSEGAFHLAPEDAIRIALSIGRKAILRHDYLPYEYCIYIIK